MQQAKKSLSWDEENLDYNEENKTPKMKIDEPPTPFNFDYCDDEAADEHGSVVFVNAWCMLSSVGPFETNGRHRMSGMMPLFDK